MKKAAEFGNHDLSDKVNNFDYIFTMPSTNQHTFYICKPYQISFFWKLSFKTTEKPNNSPAHLRISMKCKEAFKY